MTEFATRFPVGTAEGQVIPGPVIDPVVAEQDLPVDIGEREPLPLFVAVNRGCDMGCWYCTEHGENRSDERGSIRGEALMDTIRAAHESGVRTFRFTGGEPSLFGPLGDLMLATQALGDDVRIAMTTNGSRLRRLQPTLAQLRNPSVFLSVDTVRDRRDETAQNGIKLDKWLSPEVRELVATMPENVSTRINTVLTTANIDELPELIDYAVESGIDIKIFELLLRDYYYVQGTTTQAAFAAQYASVRALLPGLEAKYGKPSPYKGTGGRGMPMFSFQAGNSQIVCFDSNAGSHYGEVCDSCPLFPCQEGLYAMTLDSNGVLHPSGCPNPETYINISLASEAERTDAFRRMREMIMAATLRPDVPDLLATLAMPGRGGAIEG